MKHTTCIGRRGSKLEEVRRKLESTQLNAVRELLTDQTIRRICNECGYSFRERFLTPLVTLPRGKPRGIFSEAQKSFAGPCSS